MVVTELSMVPAERLLPSLGPLWAVLSRLRAGANRKRRFPQVAKRSINVAGLYPAGEGAGYTGGIMSAGVDGMKAAEMLGAHMLAAYKTP